MNGKASAAAGIWTAVQAVLTLITASATPLLIPGVPSWVGPVGGVVLASAVAVAKSLGVQSEAALLVSRIRTAVDAVDDAVNVKSSPAVTADITSTATPIGPAGPVFDQQTGLH